MNSHRFGMRITRAKSGDIQAINELIKQFNPLVESEISRIANRLGPNGLDAHLSNRDIAQETWTRVWSQLPTFNGSEDDQICQAKFINWLKTVTQRIANGQIDKMVAIKRGGGRTKQTLDSKLALTEGRTPSSLVREKETNQKLQLLIAKLDDTETIEILRLRFYEGMTINQIADQLSTTVDKVRYKISKAMDNLKHGFNE